MPVVMRGAPAPKKPKPANTPEEHCAVLGVTIRDLGLEPWDIAKMNVFYKKAAYKAFEESMLPKLQERSVPRILGSQDRGS